MTYAKHTGRHVWFADFHKPGPRTVLRCRKCGVIRTCERRPDRMGPNDLERPAGRRWR